MPNLFSNRRFRHHLALILGAAMLPVVPALAASYSSAAGNTIVVNSASDDIVTCGVSGTICLRDAIAQAISNTDATTITFSVDGTLIITSPLIINNLDSNPITIDGAGHQLFIDGGAQNQVFHVNKGGNLTLKGLVIQNAGSTLGAGLYNLGTVTIASSTFTKNQATDGGAIDNHGQLTVSKSIFTGNKAVTGGAVYNLGTAVFDNDTLSDNHAYAAGGALYNYGTLTVNNSSLTNNYGQVGGAIDTQDILSLYKSILSKNSGVNGGAIKNGGTATITASTLSDNQADRGGAVTNDYKLTIAYSTFSGNQGASGGALNNYSQATITASVLQTNSAELGGGVENQVGASLTLSNSTIYNNHATVGAALSNEARGVVAIGNSTITGNSADTLGGGIINQPNADLSLISSIVAGNTVSGTNGTSPDLYGAIRSRGANLIGDTTGASGFVVNDQTGVTTPGLGDLTANGGPTDTLALTAKSPAVGKGICSGDISLTPNFAPVTIDQRGVKRKTAACDVGAYELNKGATVPKASPTPPPLATPDFNFAPPSSGINS